MTHFTRNAKRSLQEEMTEHYLGSIAMNKTSGGDGISAELFKILKDDAVKVLHSHAGKFGKLSTGHRTGKGQFSFQAQRMFKLPHNYTHLTC